MITEALRTTLTSSVTLFQFTQILSWSIKVQMGTYLSLFVFYFYIMPIIHPKSHKGTSQHVYLLLKLSLVIFLIWFSTFLSYMTNTIFLKCLFCNIIFKVYLLLSVKMAELRSTKVHSSMKAKKTHRNCQKQPFGN